jgi:chorismate mutase
METLDGHLISTVVGKDDLGKEDLRAVRGATTAANNTADAIHDASEELIREIMKRNSIRAPDVVEAMFTVTPDLTAAFAATAARTRVGLNVPLLGAQEVSVDGSPHRCIRVLMHFHSLISQQKVSHVYIRGAAYLRSVVPRGSGSQGKIGLASEVRAGVGGGGGAGDAGRSALDLVRRRGVLLVGSPGDYPPFALRCPSSLDGEAALSSPASTQPAETACQAHSRWREVFHTTSPALEDSQQPDAGHVWGGSDVEMITALATALGVRVQMVSTTWGDLVRDMTERRLFDVAVGGITDTISRRTSVGFSRATAVSGKTLVVPCSLLNASMSARHTQGRGEEGPGTLQGGWSASVGALIYELRAGPPVLLNSSLLVIAGLCLLETLNPSP